MKIKNKKGISLVTLVITIAILVILTSISIGAIGENGIIAKAKNASKKNEMLVEKDIIQSARFELTVLNKKVTKDTLQQQLDNNNEKEMKVHYNGDSLMVQVISNNRYYELFNDGTISESMYKEKIEYPGDITKNNKYNGTSLESAYRIECIEDLVKFTIMSKSNTFENKYVILTKDLNFNSILSYNDYTTTEFGNINGDDIDGNELYTEMTTKNGFLPIYNFKGEFDGNNKKIENIYINRSSNYIALFGNCLSNKGKISNLILTGNIKGNNSVGGIAIKGMTVTNCINYANIQGNEKVGGICSGEAWYESIKNCVNYGNITGTTYVGGIAGVNIFAKNCKNYGNIIGGTYVGGILGFDNGAISSECGNYGNIKGTSQVGGVVGELGNGGRLVNSFNCGNVIGSKYVGGVTGFCWRGSYAMNTYNVGKVTGDSNVGGVMGYFDKGYAASNNSGNSYNVGVISGKTNVGNVFGDTTTNYLKAYVTRMYYSNKLSKTGSGKCSDIENILEAKTEEYMKSQEFVDQLNLKVSKDTDGNVVETPQEVWKKDVNGINNGYPILNWQ